MLKVNMLKNRGSSQKGNEDTSFTGNETIQFSVEDSAEQSGQVAKILMLLLWVLLLYGYEWYNISQLDAQVQAAKSRLTKIQGQVTTMKVELAKAEEVTAEYEAFKKKLELIRKIGQKRLREIRALDHLQNITPEKAWFTMVSFAENRFQLEGVAANDQTLDSLLEGIRRHSGFQDVLLAKAIEQKSDQGTLKAFIINSNLEGGG